MEAQPLSKKIHDKAKSLGVEEIMLAFSGGNDEGYLDVGVVPHTADEFGEFAQEIEEWAWNVYSYSGAGDGSDYGDTITYNLKDGQVTSEEWYNAPQTINHEPVKLEISEDEDEE